MLAFAAGASASMPTCDGRLVSIDMHLEDDGDAYTFTSAGTEVDFGTVTLKKENGEIIIGFQLPYSSSRPSKLLAGVRTSQELRPRGRS